MADYLNRATKTIVVCLAGCVGFADKLLKCVFRGSEKAKAHLQIMMDEDAKAMDCIMEGIDQNQTQALLRYADSCQLMVLPETNPQTQREYYIVPDTALRVFLGQAAGDCLFCELQGKECNKCKIRKALMDSFVLGKKDAGDCPYKGGFVV